MSSFLRYVFIALIAGGNWNNGANCGSRSRNANNVRSNVNANIGGRGSIRGIIVHNSGAEQKVRANSRLNAYLWQGCQHTQRRYGAYK